MTTRAEIVAEAMTWLHTPFHHQAAAKGAGCDCIGLLRGVGNAKNIDGAVGLAQDLMGDFAGYGMDPNPALLRAGCDRYLIPIKRAEVGLADILLFKMPLSNGQPKHFGIVTRLDPLYMIHSWAGGRAEVVENIVDQTWERRILACYRFRGID